MKGLLPVLWIRMLLGLPDPDQSLLCMASGSFHQQEKNVSKNGFFLTFYLQKLMYIYLQKVISKKTLKKLVFCVGILSATEEKSRIRIRNSMVRIRRSVVRIHGSGSGCVPKCYVSTTLILTEQTRSMA